MTFPQFPTAESVVRLLDQDAVVYVCGDAKGMARDVTQAFVDVLCQIKGTSGGLVCFIT